MTSAPSPRAPVSAAPGTAARPRPAAPQGRGLFRPISDTAFRLVNELEARLRGRYAGWAVDGDGAYRVDVALLTGDGFAGYYGRTLEAALERARRAEVRDA